MEIIYGITLLLLSIGIIIALVNTEIAPIFGIPLVALIVILNMISFRNKPIISKTLIKPELEIHITKDKTDTSYIYKQ